MAWTEEKLAAIDLKIETAGPGPVSVRFPDGSQIQRRSVQELIDFRAWVAAQVTAADTTAPPSRSFVIRTSKGIC